MKFTCTQENLLQGLTQTTPVAGRNSQLPILQHVLLQAQQNTLHLTSTDLEVGVHTNIGGKLIQEGSVTLPARSFLEYIQQLPNSHPISIEKKGNNILVNTKGFNAQFPTADPDDFPLLPEGGDGAPINLDAAALTEALAQTIFAAARDETRPEIRSIYLQSSGGDLQIAATDSFRLAESIIPLPGQQDFSLLLPLNTAHEVVRLFSGVKSLQLIPHKNHVMFYGDGVELSSRLIDGHYPDYRQIIPSTWKTSLIIPNQEFLRALKTLAVFLPRDSRRVQLTIKPDASTMLAKVLGSETGQGDVKMQITADGEEVTTLVNIQYLLEGIQHMPGKEIELRLIGEQDPLVFRPTNTHQRYLYVVMPIQAT